MQHSLRKLTLAALISLVSVSAFADTLTTLSVGALPATITYGNAFNASTTGSTFFDDYYFTIPNGSANSLTSSLNLGSIFGLTNLSARLYIGNTHETGAIAPGTLMSDWGSVVNYNPTTSVSTVVLNTITLAAGTYTLQIKGTVSGLAGGSYTGVLNLANPVPEPETYALLVAGLSLVGGVSRRKNKA